MTCIFIDSAVVYCCVYFITWLMLLIFDVFNLLMMNIWFIFLQFVLIDFIALVWRVGWVYFMYFFMKSMAFSVGTWLILYFVDIGLFHLIGIPFHVFIYCYSMSFFDCISLLCFLFWWHSVRVLVSFSFLSWELKSERFSREVVLLFRVGNSRVE